MSLPTFNPHDYCPACNTRWPTWSEVCDYCGLDPAGNQEDEAFYEDAVILWQQMQDLRQPD